MKFGVHSSWSMLACGMTRREPVHVSTHTNACHWVGHTTYSRLDRLRAMGVSRGTLKWYNNTCNSILNYWEERHLHVVQFDCACRGTHQKLIQHKKTQLTYCCCSHWAEIYLHRFPYVLFLLLQRAHGGCRYGIRRGRGNYCAKNG